MHAAAVAPVPHSCPWPPRRDDALRVPDLQAQACGGDTVLTGLLPDRAALYGTLAQIEALGLELVERTPLPPD